jgi:energy-coupling factor transport system ATP-binding protein
MRSDPYTRELPVAAKWEEVAVHYPFAPRQAVGPITLSIRQGERVLLLGPSGSGKSTLLLTLTGLIPNSLPAAVSGDITVFGSDVRSRRPWGWSQQVAQYFQDADQTLCGMRVEDELAFALENRAMPPEKIIERVTEAMQQVGLPESWRDRPSLKLSGGERQIVALAATLVQDPSLFVADEPTAHLAPQAATRLHELLMMRTTGRSVLIVDHRLDGLIQAIDRMIVLGRDGTIIGDGHPRYIFREKYDLLTSLGIWCPAASTLDRRLKEAGIAPPIPPLSVAEALAHIAPGDASPGDITKAVPAVDTFVSEATSRKTDPTPRTRVLTRLVNADCAPFLGPTVLRDINLTIHEGEILGILGPNGAGKSTLGLSLAGLLPLKAGKRVGAPGGYAFQRPENQFIAGSVREELLGALAKDAATPDNSELVARALAFWRLSGFENMHPFELSHGQKRRLSLAILTISQRWRFLVLDEPLAGLDADAASTLSHTILALQKKGCALAIITHDMDFALRLCPRSIIVGEERIIADGPTQELMSNSSLLKRSGLAEPSCAEAMRWLSQVAAC